jgi:hypothetical protein
MNRSAGFLALTLAALAGAALAAEPAETYGPHRIEHVAGKSSYILHVSASGGAAAGFIALRCFADEQALTLRIGAPSGAQKFEPRQTITVWSDKTPAIDITLSGDPSGTFAIAAMNESAGLEADAAFMALFEAVIGAEQHISYSIGADAVTLDATHLQAARARFAQLCARPANP